ncbi:cell division control protein 45 homolog [Caerostris extrusa]|uniref:Cell division control protein 45 homolog n=1 Tax=Caerostris extrusa TaxID=172846 RepID=A0AAV4R6H1_CAEEX|nr:cell division control protein 45 homolog [Caerostris extrusa]
MFVTDIRNDFYNVITDNRVLLLAGCDVDAICATKILQYLFQCDNILYTLIPVYGKQSLEEAFIRHKDQTKCVVMLNCGCKIDIVETLDPPEDMVFFIADSHRPINVYNIYSESQIRLLMNLEDCEGIPAYNDIFRDTDSDDDEEEGTSSDEVIMKRREKRLWEENRNKIMFDYSQISYHGEPASLLMFDLAWKMSRDNNDLLWWAIIGLTEQLVMDKIEQDKYIISASNMQSHVARLNRVDTSSSNTASSMKVTFDKELNLALYRHWSLYDSIMNSRYTACKFKLWSFKGQKRMLEFLAEIGLPLFQCKQKFSAMDMEYRNNVSTWMEDLSDKYKLDKIIYGAFISQCGFKGKFSASDVVLAINALLESIDKEKTITDKFLDALYALSKGEVNAIKKGIDLAKLRLVAIFRQVQVFIDMKQIINPGPFMYAIVPNTTHDSKYFSLPGCLSMLAHFTLEAHVNNTRNRRVTSLPLLLFAPDDSDSNRCIAIGIPPISAQSPKNFFAKAFEQAAEQSRINISQDLFVESVIYIHKNDQAKFLSALFLLLS